MNRKTLLFGAIALLVMFAVLPAANAVVLDPSGCPSGNSTAVLKIYKEYNSTYQTCNELVYDSLMKKYNVGVNASKLDNILENKPISNLTWNEAYYMAGLYSVSKNEGRNIEYLPRYHKDLQYAKQMINARNTTQSRALAYETMAEATQFRSNSGKPGSDVWMQRALPYFMKFIENDPSAMINNGDGDSNVTWWGDIGIKDLRDDGYKFSNKAVAFDNKVMTAAEDGKLNTPAELRNIGFYQWKKQDIIPLEKEKGPERSIPYKINNIITTHVSGILPFYLKYGSTIFKGVGILFVLSIVLLVVKRRRNRYY